jgi:phage terminase small subunit
MNLNPRKQRFITEYLVDLNATQAAIRAGYRRTSAHNQGCRLLRDPEVAQAVTHAQQARAERTAITQDRVLREYARLAFFDARQVLYPDGSPRPLHELDEDTAAAISGIEISTLAGRARDGSEAATVRKYRLADKKPALDALARHLGLFIDKPEHTDGTLAERLARARRAADTDTEPTTESEPASASESESNAESDSELH